MIENDEFKSALSSYKNTLAIKQKLKTDIENINYQIATAKDKLEWLQNSYLPLQDFKESIIEFLSQSGQSYLGKMIRPAITELAVNRKWGLGFPPEKFGTPMNYQIVQKAINADLPQFMACQIFTPDKSIFFDDRAFLAFLFNVIEPTLRNTLEKMSPQEFGYDRIKPDQIGPGLEERIKMIQDTEDELKALEQNKADIAEKIRALGN